MDKIIESLHIITIIDLTIQNYIKALAEVQENHFIFLGIKSQILLLANSYIDEWDKYLIPKSDNEEFNQQIKISKKHALPAIRRIKKWNGIKYFRNSVLAHNFRDKKENYKSVFLSDKFDKLNIPEHISELFLLSYIIKLSTNIVCFPFKQKLEKTKDKYFEDKGSNMKEVDFETELKSIVDEIRNNKQN